MIQTHVTSTYIVCVTSKSHRHRRDGGEVSGGAASTDAVATVVATTAEFNITLPCHGLGGEGANRIRRRAVGDDKEARVDSTRLGSARPQEDKAERRAWREATQRIPTDRHASTVDVTDGSGWGRRHRLRHGAGRVSHPSDTCVREPLSSPGFCGDGIEPHPHTQRGSGGPN